MVLIDYVIKYTNLYRSEGKSKCHQKDRGSSTIRIFYYVTRLGAQEDTTIFVLIPIIETFLFNQHFQSNNRAN